MAKSKSDYAQKLRDPRWQKRRLEILEAAQWKCEDCENDGSELQIHHCCYIKGREPWEYTRNSLMALCDRCHQERQQVEAEAKSAFSVLLRFSPFHVVRMWSSILENCVIKDVRYNSDLKE